jgi:CRP-like cAMP-binding protein
LRDGVAVLAELIDEEEHLLHELLSCPPAHFLEYTIIRKCKGRPVAESDGLLKRVHRQIVRRIVAKVVADPAIASQDDVARIQGMLAHLGRLHPRMARRLENGLRGGWTPDIATFERSAPELGAGPPGED